MRVIFHLRETWDKIKENVDCFLVDCRTSAEWSLIGVPDLDSLGKKVIFIEWQIFPTMEKNPRFLQEISETDLKKIQKSFFCVDPVLVQDLLQNS